MRVALAYGLSPTRTPLNAVIHGRFEGDDYTVEKVFFESMPDFYVTGNLYRPKALGRRRKNGPEFMCARSLGQARFRLLDDAGLKKERRTAGTTRQGGRSIFQALGVQTRAEWLRRLRL